MVNCEEAYCIMADDIKDEIPGDALYRSVPELVLLDWLEQAKKIKEPRVAYIADPVEFYSSLIKAQQERADGLIKSINSIVFPE